MSAMHGCRPAGFFLAVACLAFSRPAPLWGATARNDESRLGSLVIEDSTWGGDTSLAQATPQDNAPVPPDPTIRRRPSTSGSEVAPGAGSTSRPPAPAVSQARPPAELPTAPNLMAELWGNRYPTRGSERLAGVPNMFGDLFPGLGASVVYVNSAFDTTSADLPLAAGARRVKIAENNKALTEDRVYFMYNHFENALRNQSDVTGDLIVDNRSVDRYTLGFERTLFNERWSVELRLPLAGRNSYETPEFGVSGGCVGNLAVMLKRVIYESDTTAVAIGMGVDTPTGSEASGFAVDLFDTTYFTVHNQAVHLLPYAGFVRAPDNRFFCHGFVQCDVPTNGNRIDFADTFDSGTIGTLNEQTLLYLDFSAGYWLYRNQCARRLSGLAAVAEVHYTTALQDSDVVSMAVGVFPWEQLSFGNFANRMDIVNLTVGIHAEIDERTLCRVGGVFPLSDGDDRSFDSELQVQIERRF